MTERTLPLVAERNPALSEAPLIAGSVALLCGLALADRVAAWMIGQFPTSAALWELRFEYLRPIGLFYDMTSLSLGRMSGVWFSAFLLAAATVFITGSLSRIRLVRALSTHALLASCLALCASSLGFYGTKVAIGSPSSFYAVLGAAVALLILPSCLRIHAEYMGLDPASSRFARRLRNAAIEMRDRIAAPLAGFAELLAPASGRAVALARRDLVGNRRARR